MSPHCRTAARSAQVYNCLVCYRSFSHPPAFTTHKKAHIQQAQKILWQQQRGLAPADPAPPRPPSLHRSMPGAVRAVAKAAPATGGLDAAAVFLTWA